MLLHGLLAKDMLHRQRQFRYIIHRSDVSHGTTMFHVLVYRNSIQFLRSFFYYSFHFFSMMQSFDLYKMICDPLKYSEFCEFRSVFKCLLIGISFCIFISCDHVFAITVTVVHILTQLTKFSWRNSLAYEDMNDKIEIFTLVKIIVVKIVYIVCVVRMSLSIQRALRKSNDLNKNGKKQELHKRIHFFTAIPIGVSVMLIFPELLIAVSPANQVVSAVCTEISLIQSLVVRACVTVTLITMGTLAHYLGYFVLVPKTRDFFNGLVCKSRENA